MPVVASCGCGIMLPMEEKHAGQKFNCPGCGAAIDAVYTTQPIYPVASSGLERVRDVFARDQFLLRQKYLTINEKYVVWDERGDPILHVVRPRHFWRSLLAVMTGILVALAATAFSVWIATLIKDDNAGAVLILAGIVVGTVAAIVVGIAISPKRHIYFYLDEKLQKLALQIFQDRKLHLWNATYTIADPEGKVLALLEKNFIYAIIRKHWDCRDTEGRRLCTAQEDHLALAILRRLIGPFFGILRTNFIFIAPDNDTVLGDFNRKFTILDRYSLNMFGDPHRWVDRRIILAMGVMLDTGERR